MVLESRKGYLVYLSAGDVPFFRVSFSPIFFQNGVSKEGKFSGAGCQNMSKEEILLLFSPILVFLSILFTDFSRTGYHFKAKVLEQGETFFCGHIPVQI